MWKLSEGSIAKIMNGGTVENPVMQILGCKKMASSSDCERYRLLVSDGQFVNSFAMLATHLNSKVLNGELGDYTVVKVSRLITSVVNSGGKAERRIMIILDVEILAPGSEVGLKIGNPVPYNEGAVEQTSEVQKPQAVPSMPNTMLNRNSNASSSGIQLTNLKETHPITSLSPYQNKWVIKARVTNKTPIKRWSNQRGEGYLFSMDLVDESGEIRATAFKEACDKYYQMIEVNKVYYITRCQLKPANKQFSSIKNDYEMTFTNDTVVEPCLEDSDVPSVSFNFVSIDKLPSMDANELVDVLGVVKNCNDVVSFVARTTNRELKKRELLFVDESNKSVTLTMWGSQAEEFDGSSQPVLAIKGARISDFNGARSLSVLQASTLQCEPDIPEAHRLKGWFRSVGCTQDSENISSAVGGGMNVGGASSNWLTFREVRNNQLGGGEKADYYTCRATVIMVQAERAVYKACPTPECNKKVLDQNTGMYRCEKCNKEFPDFKYRLLISVNLADWTGGQWVTCFQDVAEQILGASAQTVGEASDSNDAGKLQEICQKAHFKSFIFKLRVKMETFHDENRLKTTAVQVKPMDYKEYIPRLLSEIKKISGVGSSSM